MDSHFYAACTSRHESSMIPKALKFATLKAAESVDGEEKRDFAHESQMSSLFS